MSTCEVLAQPMENISSSAYRIRHAKVAIQSGRNQGQVRAITASVTRFHVSVVIVPHLAGRASKWFHSAPTNAGKTHAAREAALGGQQVNAAALSELIAAAYRDTSGCASDPHNEAFGRAKSGPKDGVTVWTGAKRQIQSASGDAFSALATPPALAHWHRAMLTLTPLASHPWPLRVQFRVAARQNRRRDRPVPTRAHL
ncbi:hypothetical protein V1288_004694 [Bradyrhizobium sp. AZCC 2176]